jgi:hypothetical protein
MWYYPTLSAIGRQGMLTLPGHLIPPPVCSGSVLAHLFLWIVIPTCVSRLITLRYLSHFIKSKLTILIMNCTIYRKLCTSRNCLIYVTMMKVQFIGIEIYCACKKKLPNCSTGKHLNRKTTKNHSSGAIYAKDCYILYVFTQGKKSSINGLFHKIKDSFLRTDISNMNLVKLRTGDTFLNFRSFFVNICPQFTCTLSCRN